MQVQTFEMPEPGASLLAFQDAARKLSAVQLTHDQIQEGYRVYVAAPHDRQAVLTAWTEAHGLMPAEVAAHAIVVRATAVMDALSDGIAMETEMPDLYRQLLTGPIYPADLGYYPSFHDEDELAH